MRTLAVQPDLGLVPLWGLYFDHKGDPFSIRKLTTTEHIKGNIE